MASLLYLTSGTLEAAPFCSVDMGGGPFAILYENDCLLLIRFLMVNDLL